MAVNGEEDTRVCKPGDSGSPGEAMGAPSKIKAVIFDIDGVLADSRQAVITNTELLMREFGFAVPDGKVEGMSTAHSAESVLIALAPSLAGDAALLEKMLRRLSELTQENLGLVKPTSLVKSVPLLARKYKLAAATNRKASARMVLERLGVASCFSAVLTSADAQPKPSPKMITLCLKRLDVAACEAVFVGDNEEDMQAWNTAGVKTIMLDGTDVKDCERLLAELL